MPLQIPFFMLQHLKHWLLSRVRRDLACLIIFRGWELLLVDEKFRKQQQLCLWARICWHMSKRWKFWLEPSSYSVNPATTHTDLFEDLKPSVYIHKRFGKEIEVQYFPNEINKECSLAKEMRIVEGSRQDYYQLAGFHYRSHKVAGVRKIFCLKRGNELRGVVVYSYPPARCFGRKLVLPKMSMLELNQKVSIISRVVVHPKSWQRERHNRLERNLGSGQKKQCRQSLHIVPQAARFDLAKTKIQALL